MDDEGQRETVVYLERRAAGIAEEHDFRLVTAEGRTLWTRMNTSPIVHRDGTYRGCDRARHRRHPTPAAFGTAERDRRVGPIRIERNIVGGRRRVRDERDQPSVPRRRVSNRRPVEVGRARPTRHSRSERQRTPAGLRVPVGDPDESVRAHRGLHRRSALARRRGVRRRRRRDPVVGDRADACAGRDSPPGDARPAHRACRTGRCSTTGSSTRCAGARGSVDTSR